MQYTPVETFEQWWKDHSRLDECHKAAFSKAWLKAWDHAELNSREAVKDRDAEIVRLTIELHKVTTLFKIAYRECNRHPVGWTEAEKQRIYDSWYGLEHE